MTYLILKYFLVIGAIVILGTGAGIAFFMLMAYVSGDVRHIARPAATVVLGDYIFTATAVIAQPVSGYLLTQEAGFALTDSWIWLSLALYAVAGVFWLPVVWMQRRMRDLARAADAQGAPLTSELWIEPLGALVKTGPAIVLMLVALAMLDGR